MTKQYIIHSACFVAIIGGVVLGIWHTKQKLYRDRLIVLTCDEQIAPECRSRLRNNILSVIHQEKITDAATVLAALHKEFPALTNVTLNYRTPGITKIKLLSARPLLIIKQINQSPSVLAENAAYVPYQHYTASMLQGVPSIIVSEPLTNRDALFQWLKKLPHDFFARYTAQWNKVTEITLHDTNAPHFVYVTSHTTPWTPALEEQLAQVRANHIPTSKKYKKWLIDVRFKDRLIIKGVS